MILAGDIGGTKTTLALYEKRQNIFKPTHKQTYSSRDYPDFYSIMDTFFPERNDTVQSACFGVAGPVLDQRCHTTNLPWVIDAREIRSRYKMASIHLLNDLEATAYGTLILPNKAKAALHRNDTVASAAASGHQAVLSTGTGLGEAVLYWDGAQYRPVASEGGHVDFAPRNETEIALLEYLLKQYPHVSYERVLSGPGLILIYQFMQSREKTEEPPWLTERFALEDPAAVITNAAIDEKSALCVKTLDLFISILGAEAGNLALKSLATGGVYLGGGISPKILSKLQSGIFMTAFLEKGRYRTLLSKIPVWVLLDSETPLLGAAHYAAELNAPLQH